MLVPLGIVVVLVVGVRGGDNGSLVLVLYPQLPW